jgi:hypothetical protein
MATQPKLEDAMQQQMVRLQTELQHMQAQLSTRPTSSKDMSLVTLIPKWSGTDKATPLHEFFEAIEGTSRVGNWSETDKIQVAVLKLTEVARTFYNTELSLHSSDVTWVRFKEAFYKRFKDVRTDQFHYMELQTARQRKNESPQEFADRCRALSQKIVQKSEDPMQMKFQWEQASRLTLASFTAGLYGIPGRQVRYSRPSSLEEALQIAISVDQAEKQERRNESFYVERSSTHYGARRKTHGRSKGNGRQARDEQPHRGSSSNEGTRRNVQPVRSFQCYQCGGEGHIARVCPSKPSKSWSEDTKKYVQIKDREKPPGKEKLDTKGKPKAQGN